MASLEFDNVKAEKAIAISLYRRQGKIRRTLELCAALFLALQSFAWFPLAAGFAGDIFRQLVAVYNNQLYVFLLFNVTMFVVYALSRRESRPRVNEAEAFPYQPFIENSESRERITARTPDPAESPEETFEDKEVVFSENATSPVRELVVSKTFVVDQVLSTLSDSVHAIAEYSSEAKPYRKTQSQRFELRTAEKSRREFRHSETDICLRISNSGAESPRRWCLVEEMNDDEFKHMVEAFIAEKKWIQRKEYREERKAE